MNTWSPTVCLCKFETVNGSLSRAIHKCDIHAGLSDQGAWDAVLALIAALPPLVPQSLTPYQLKKELHLRGLLTTVEEAVAGADFITQLAWKEAVSFQRTDTLLLGMAQDLSISSATLDSIFIEGAKHD